MLCTRGIFPAAWRANSRSRDSKSFLLASTALATGVFNNVTTQFAEGIFAQSITGAVAIETTGAISAFSNGITASSGAGSDAHICCIARQMPKNAGALHVLAERRGMEMRGGHVQ
jgi:hypothetical protein